MRFDMEKRHGSRVPFKTEAEITVGGATIKGEIKNLSLNGLFLLTDNILDTGLSVDVAIELSGSSTKLTISLKGIVTRQEENGISLKFDEMELDSFIHLKNILHYSNKDMDDFDNFNLKKETDA